MEKGTSDQNGRTDLPRQKCAKCKGLSSGVLSGVGGIKGDKREKTQGGVGGPELRTTLSCAGDRKSLLAWHSGINKYINIRGWQKIDCEDKMSV